jgi:hypothetical protein
LTKGIHTIKNPQETFNQIDKLIKVVFNGFMATAMDYGYHINNTVGKSQNGQQTIFEFRDNIHYRLESAKLHFYLLLSRKIQTEGNFSQMLKDNPKIFDGFIMGNPYFERASDEIMGIFDSVIFHISSSFDYIAMLMQFVFGNNPQSKLQWITLSKHCYNKSSEFSGKGFTEYIKDVNRDFVSKYNDYRAELIHRKKSTSFAEVTWEINSGKVNTHYKCSDKIKSHLKKVLDREKDYCITYVTNKVLIEAILNIAKVLEGINKEFRENYHPNSPNMKTGGFQIVSIDGTTNMAISPALNYWEEFNKYKTLVKT